MHCCYQGILNLDTTTISIGLSGCIFILMRNMQFCRFQRPRGLRRRSAAALLLRSWVRIPPGAWMFVCCECCLLSGGGLCDELITRPEESYRLCCVVVCDLETSRMGAPYIYDISRLKVNIVLKSLNYSFSKHNGEISTLRTLVRSCKKWESR